MGPTDDLRIAAAHLRADVSYWSVRWQEQATERLDVHSDVVQPPTLSVDRGAMVTAVTESGYGYAATSDCSRSGLQAALDRASEWARATRGLCVQGVEPAMFDRDPVRVIVPALRGIDFSRRDLLDFMREECASARIDGRITDRLVSIELRRVRTLFLSNAGADIEQHFNFVLPYAHVIASEGGASQSRTFDQYQQGGMETLERVRMRGRARTLADEVLQLLAAPNCPAGAMDLLLMPDQMMLQIHESIGHPLELDRILGDERNYAGTSFVTPAMFGSYQYGSPLLNVTYDPGDPIELASFAFDDDGTPAEKATLIRAGILQQPLGGRLSQRRGGMPGVANSRACGWNRPPIDRMANLNVEVGESTFNDMIGSIENGVLMRTNTSWSIDDSRNKFQFGCEWGQRIANGKLQGVVRNPNYRGISATFWRSLAMVGDRDTFEVHGTLYCGKGEPNQAIHVGHASPACLFRNVDVFGGAG
ncbi:MAG: TldD/PmbA family protein [Burkholderiales bacterium]